MIEKLSIQNFKSIRKLEIPCERLNIFIGEPNVGKSNILESLGLFSYPYLSSLPQFGEMARFENFADMFYDSDVSKPIEINAIEGSGLSNKLRIQHEGGRFAGHLQIGGASHAMKKEFEAAADGLVQTSSSRRESGIKFYKFPSKATFGSKEFDYLRPMDGGNLPWILQINKELRTMAAALFQKRGLELAVNPQRNEISVQKKQDGLVVNHPYSSASDTLRRFIFHLAAVRTNKNSAIIIEEPESHAFPYYTRLLAEDMAKDSNGNQYFVSTHNPYFLFPFLYKAPKNETAVFLTIMQGYETQVHRLSGEQIQEAMEMDADLFFNFDQFFPA
ncbi:MAG TPA: AAA family ATPase [Elusimicrobiota bacterium]|nr:AAA family ATPase [Elusimicrobiota bacterium]